MTTILEHEMQTLQAFQSNVHDLAQKELDRLEAERVELEQALISVKGALRSVRATLVASAPKEMNGKKKSKKAPAKRAFEPSAARLLEFSEWLGSKRKNENLTTADLYEATGWAGSYANLMMKWARENHYIRQSAIVGTRRIYRKMS